MKRCVFWFVMLILIALSCKEKDVQKSHYSVKEIVKKELVLPYHEDTTAGKDKIKFVQNFAVQMGLPRLSGGSQNLNLRIWLWNLDTSYVINFSDDGTRKTCNIYAFKGKKADSAVSIVVYKQWKEITPVSGWDTFLNILHYSGILDLDSSKIPRKQFLTHMGSVQFEIARPDIYRFYSYVEPSFYRTVDPGASTIHRFLNYVNKEMMVTAYEPEDIVATPE